MVRGRKKGGISINNVNDKSTLVDMIINQVNSLNKKLKSFSKQGIEEHRDFVNSMLGNTVQYNDKGSISKSRKNFNEKSIPMLKKTLSALHKTNNNDFYGTVKKYEREVTKNVTYVKEYAEKFLRDKGYSEQFILEVTSSKDFYAQIFMAFKNGDSKYGSGQVIEKVALNYENSGISEKERNKILQNIEYSRNTMDSIRQEVEEYQEYKRMKKMR